MRYLIIIFFILGLGTFAKSQDRIITKKGDTISCKITRISEQYIHYVLSQENPVRSRIRLADVASYDRAEEAPVIEEEDEPVATTPYPDYDDFDSFRSFRVALSPMFTFHYDGDAYEDFPDSYTKQARSLWGWAADLQYFPSKNFGLGVKINRISTPTSQDMLLGLTNVRETLRFQYIALSILSRQQGLGERDNLYYSFSGGLINYRDDATINGSSYFEEGETFGLGLDIGYDFLFSDNFGIGINVGLNLATMTRININGTVASGTFGLSRLDVGLGIRYVGN